MAKTLYINDVTERTEDTWRVKVLVAQKSNVYTTERGKRIQKMILIDEEGERVEGVIWSDNIDVLEGNLKAFSTYIVGGAQVQTIKTGFQYATPGITMQWVISRGTYIRRVTEDAEKLPYPTVHQVSFAEIPSLADTGETMDIVAAVLDVKEPRLVDVKGKLTPIRECTVVQAELKPLMLTLWGNFADQQGMELFVLRKEKPIILCKGLKATSFTGVSLSTVPFSFVAVEPQIPEVATLREWLSCHLDDVQEQGKKPKQSYLQTAAKDHGTIRVTKLKDISLDAQTIHARVTMSIPDIQQRVAYTACPKCKQTQKALYGETFSCNMCKEELLANAHCKIVVKLTDDSGTINATLFDHSAEQLLGKTPEEMHSMDKQKMAHHLREINLKLATQEIVAQIRGTKKTFNDKIPRYTVQDWVENKDLTLSATTSATSAKPGTSLSQVEQTASQSINKRYTSEGVEASVTDDSPTKKTKMGHNSDTASPSQTNSTPMKKLQLKSPERE